MQPTAAFNALCSWPNLWQAWQRAAAGKRGRPTTAAFEYAVADRLLALQAQLRTGHYRPLPYTQFVIHEPKRRCISAAAFQDRVVHHALCAIIEPRFERLFLPHSFANRVGKGTHGAVQSLQALAREYPWVLRADVRQHFPSIDHAVLLQALGTQIPEPDVMALVRTIVSSGDGWDQTVTTAPQQRTPIVSTPPALEPFPGDDLLAVCRPRGLPIGNLTSQFWSNCVLHALDLLVVRELRCPGYVRYVDDFALFGHSKQQLWQFKAAVVERLQRLRLRVHEGSMQVVPTRAGTPWLGFVVYPTHLLVKSRNVRHTTRKLASLYGSWCEGHISFGEFDACVQGWVAHVQQADSWGLRRHVLAPFELPPGFAPQYPGRGKNRPP
jgi:RNA-directed DNA polymerase